jgi:hypothetical protein
VIAPSSSLREIIEKCWSNIRSATVLKICSFPFLETDLV